MNEWLYRTQKDSYDFRVTDPLYRQLRNRAKQAQERTQRTLESAGWPRRLKEFNLKTMKRSPWGWEMWSDVD